MKADFSPEAMAFGSEWHNIFQALKEKSCQLQTPYPVKESFRSAGEIKLFPNEEKQRELAAIRPIFKERIKKTLQTERATEKVKTKVSVTDYFTSLISLFSKNCNTT